MKRLITLFVLAFTTCMLMAQTPKDVKYVFTEASDLNLIGKIQENTPNPYHRVDTLRYKGFSTGENIQVRCPAGGRTGYTQGREKNEGEVFHSLGI